MLTLTFLGDASGKSTAIRYDHSSVLMQSDDTSILIDCGEPAAATLTRLGLPWDSIDAVFISHMHADHMGGLFQLIKAMQLNGRRKDLTLYVPEEAVRSMQAFLLSIYLMPEVLPFELRILGLKDGLWVDCLGMRVQARATGHLHWVRRRLETVNKSYPDISFECYGFLVAGGDSMLLYSGDVETVADITRVLNEEPVDVLITEMAHLEPEKALPQLAECEVGRVIIHHYHPKWDTDPGELPRIVERYLGNRAVIVKSGDVFSVGRGLCERVSN